MTPTTSFEKTFTHEWPLVPLDRVCAKRVENRDPRSIPDGAFTYVDISSVDNLQKQIVAPKKLVGRDAPSRARQIIRRNDVLVATTRPNLNAVALVPGELDEQIASTGFCVLRPMEELDSVYLFAFVQAQVFVERLSEFVKGALYPAVTDGQVRAQLIPLPPLTEQRRIAGRLREQLAEVAKARTAVQAQLAAAQALPAAVLRRELESNGVARWQRFAIQQLRKDGVLTEHQDGNHGELHPRSRDFVPTGVRFITAKHFRPDGTVAIESASCLSPDQARGLRIGFAQPSDVLLAHNATVGPVAIAPNDCEPFVVGTSVTIFRTASDKMLPDFLFLALRSTDFQKQLVDAMKQTTRNQVPITRQRLLELPVPPLDEQRIVSARLSAELAEVTRLRESLSGKLETLDRLPAALLAQAFQQPAPLPSGISD